jgi:hypothetical protein
VLSLQGEYPFTNRVGVGYQEDQLELGLMQGGSASLVGRRKTLDNAKVFLGGFF